MSNREKVDVAEVVVGFMLGVIVLYYSFKGSLPASLFVPDGLLSIAAALLAADGYRVLATGAILVAWVLFLGWILVYIHNAGSWSRLTRALPSTGTRRIDLAGRPVDATGASGQW